MEVVEATSVEGMRSQAGTSAEGVPSQVATSIRASVGNSVDSGATPYSVSAAFFLATTSVAVSVTVTQAIILLTTARSTLTAITLPWAATIRILVRRINSGLVTKPPNLDCDTAVARCSADSRARTMMAPP
jgi:hypothetical protein